MAPILDASPDEPMPACRQLGLEGFMAKRRNAVHLAGQRSAALAQRKRPTECDIAGRGWSEV